MLLQSQLLQQQRTWLKWPTVSLLMKAIVTRCILNLSPILFLGVCLDNRLLVPVEDVFVAFSHPHLVFNERRELHNSIKKVFGFATQHRPQVLHTQSRFHMMRRPVHRSFPNRDSCESDHPIEPVSEVYVSQDSQCNAILDTGASRCVVGEKIWSQLVLQLPQNIQQQIRKLDSKVSFRFGNNQSLTSVCKVQIPLANTTTGRIHSGCPLKLFLEAPHYYLANGHSSS